MKSEAKPPVSTTRSLDGTPKSVPRPEDGSVSKMGLAGTSAESGCVSRFGAERLGMTRYVPSVQSQYGATPV